MSLEIEHKYLVINDEYKALSTEHHEIRQGYLNRSPERTVRIRIYDNKGFLTVKGKNKGDTRLEFEYEIPIAEAEIMINMCEQPIIEKTRWIVPFQGLIWEVDEFHGLLCSLTLAEIELPTSDTPYEKPLFIGENVTDNPRYYNSNLSAIS